MALTPGPTKPPPPPGDARDRPTESAGMQAVVRWGVLIGGLNIVADLAAIALQQRLGPEAADAIQTADLAVNAVLLAMAGSSVLRETGRVLLGAAAGVLAGLIDGVVVAVAGSMAPLPGQQVPPEMLLLGNLVWNVGLGFVLAGAAAWVSRLAHRRPGS